LETEWKDLARQIAPVAGDFLPSSDPLRDRNSLRGSIINPAGAIALRTMVSGFESGATNKAMPWVQFKMQDPDLNRYKPVKEFLEIVKNTVLETFIKSNIYKIFPKVYRDLGLFATGGMSVVEGRKSPLHCTHFPVGSFLLGTDEEDRVNTVIREYKMTAEQMVHEFGEKKVSSRVKSAYDRGNYDQWFDVIWMVEPNPEAREDYLFSKHMPFKSTKWEPSESGEPLSLSGFPEFPMMFPRWDVEGVSPYGTDCPAMLAFGSTKSLQSREREGLNALHKAVNPPMAGPTGMERPSQIPGSVTIEPQGPGQGFRPAVQINPHFAEMRGSCDKVENTIDKIFYSDLFLMLSNSQDQTKTAYEVARLEDEKRIQLSSVVTRINDEMLDPLVERTLGVLFRAGKLPPAPPEMQDQMMAFEYVSIISQAMKSVGITAIERGAQFIGANMVNFPEMRDKINPDKMVDQYFERIGTPPDIIHDDNETATIRQDRAQRDQMAQAAASMGTAAQIGKTLSETNVTDPSALTQIQAAMQGGGALPGASGVMASPMQGGVPNG
jgi:hypothetical protein